MKTTDISKKLLKMMLLMVMVLIVGCSSAAPQHSKPEPEANVAQMDDSIIHFIDTGNSDAILIQQGDKGVLIDGGDNNDEEMLPQYIKEQGVTTLDYIFATHPDADHIGGLDGVMEAIKVNQVFVSNGEPDTKTYKDFIEAIMRQSLKPSVPLLDSTFKFGDGDFKVMSVANKDDYNNNSIVLLYTHGQDRMLFMGDAGQEIEQNIKCEAVDLIKVGHHGSSTSSGKSFLEQVAPKYAVITVGANNKYGHPHKETMETLEELGIPVYRTDEGGTVIFTSTGEGMRTTATINSYASGDDKSRDNNGYDKVSNVVKIQGKKTDSSTQTKEISDKIFFTTNGKNYHSKATCSGMKSPIEATLEDVGDRSPCSKCF